MWSKSWRGVPAGVIAGLLATTVTAGLLVLPTQPAAAETAAQARREARQAASAVDALAPRVTGALAAYERSLAGLAGSVSVSIRADAAADHAVAVRAELRREQVNRVRAVYMSGGSMALYASVMDARDASEALRRVTYVQRVLSTGEQGVRAAGSLVGRLQGRAATLDTAADARVLTARDVEADWVRLSGLLGQARASLDRLSSRARQLQDAERAAAILRAAEQQLAEGMQDRIARARALLPLAAYRRMYVEAAATCPGLSWTILSAIGQVESGHGRNPGISSSGALGPMQFLPSTFGAYAVDGDRDGDKDILDPADAIFTASHYLCANGAGDPRKLYGAIWHYNHADWYVQLVLKIAAQLPAH